MSGRLADALSPVWAPALTGSSVCPVYNLPTRMINPAVSGSRHGRDSAYRDWSSVLALKTSRMLNFDSRGSLTPWRIHYWISHCLPTCNEVIWFLCSLNIHDSIHRNLPLDLIVNQMKPLCIIRPHFVKIHFDIVIPIKAGHSMWLLPINFSTTRVGTLISGNYLFTTDTK